jgi:cell division protein FtsB
MRKIKTKTISSRRLNYLMAVILAALIGFQVYLSNQIATSGRLLNELEQKAVVLEDDNRKLLSQNVTHMSLHELSEKARNLGYVEPEEVLNFSQGSQKLALH